MRYFYTGRYKNTTTGVSYGKVKTCICVMFYRKCFWLTRRGVGSLNLQSITFYHSSIGFKTFKRIKRFFQLRKHSTTWMKSSRLFWLNWIVRTDWSSGEDRACDSLSGSALTTSSNGIRAESRSWRLAKDSEEECDEPSRSNRPSLLKHKTKIYPGKLYNYSKTRRSIVKSSS